MVLPVGNGKTVVPGHDKTYIVARITLAISTSNVQTVGHHSQGLYKTIRDKENFFIIDGELNDSLKSANGFQGKPWAKPDSRLRYERSPPCLDLLTTTVCNRQEWVIQRQAKEKP